MTNFKQVKIEEGKVIVPIDLNQLRALMCECAMLAIENYRKEEKKVSEQKWVSSTEAAKMFGCSLSTINRWKHSGYITARNLGGKDFFSKEELTKLAISAA